MKGFTFRKGKKYTFDGTQDFRGKYKEDFKDVRKQGQTYLEVEKSIQALYWELVAEGKPANDILKEQYGYSHIKTEER